MTTSTSSQCTGSLLDGTIISVESIVTCLPSKNGCTCTIMYVGYHASGDWCRVYCTRTRLLVQCTLLDKRCSDNPTTSYNRLCSMDRRTRTTDTRYSRCITHLASFLATWIVRIAHPQHEHTIDCYYRHRRYISCIQDRVWSYIWRDLC